MNKEYIIRELHIKLKNNSNIISTLKKLKSECFELISAIDETLYSSNSIISNNLLDELVDVGVMSHRTLLFLPAIYKIDEDSLKNIVNDVSIKKMKRALKRIEEEK